MTAALLKRNSSTHSRRVAKARRHFRVRKTISGSSSRPRLVVTRSLRHITVQIVDDTISRTLVSATTINAKLSGDKTQQARQIGTLLGQKAREAGVTTVVFDRSGNKYHGRIAALADAAREAGLEF